MKIEWNKVTWYSKLLAVILFAIVFYVGFDLGEQVIEVTKNTPPLSVSSVTTPVPINTASYLCDGGKIIIAKYYNGPSKVSTSPDIPPVPGGSVKLDLSDGRVLNIPQTISADGARYANTGETFVFWSKGNGAFITEQNPNIQTYADCVVASQTTSS